MKLFSLFSHNLNGIHLTEIYENTPWVWEAKKRFQVLIQKAATAIIMSIWKEEKKNCRREKNSSKQINLIQRHYEKREIARGRTVALNK